MKFNFLKQIKQRKLYKALIIGCCVFLFQNTYSQWTQLSNGIYGGPVIQLYSFNGNLFAGTSYSGIFKSSDNGTSWISANTGLNLNNVNPNSFTSSGNNIYVANNSSSGVSISSDNGASWSPFNAGVSSIITRLRSSGNNLFAAGNDGKTVYTATNGGSSWNEINTGFTDAYSIAINGSNLFIGSLSSGVYKSTNGGTTWTSVNNGLPNTQVSGLDFSGTNLFATISGAVYVSSNNGTSWSVVPNTSYINNVSGSYIFASFNNGNNFTYSLSSNSGTTWSSLTPPVTNSIGQFTTNSSNLFVGTSDGVYISSDNGNSWSLVNNGLTNTTVTALINSGTNIFAGTSNSKVYLSANSGVSWTPVNSGLPTNGNGIYGFAVNGSNLFAGVFGGGVYLSTNNGSSWAVLNNGLTNLNIFTLTYSGGTLYAGTYNGGIFKSTNNGTLWAPINTGLPITSNRISSIVVNGSTIYCGIYGGGVYSSTDSGSSWSAMNTGLNDNYITSLILSSGKLYASSYNSGVYTYAGGVWSQINSGIFNTQIHSLSSNGVTLFAVTENGFISHSTNSGANWEFSGPSQYINAITITSVGNSTYVGSYNGVWSAPITNYPGISTVTPTTSTIGSSITINGLNFNTTPSNNIVQFNGTSATVTSASATSLTVTVPSGATTGTIAVTVGGQTATSATNFTVVPTVTSFTPASGTIGSTVTINGTGFSTTASNNTVKFNGISATVTSASATSLTVTIPSGATTGTIAVTVGGQIATGSMNFTIVPSITSFAPTSGAIGSTVTINGTSFDPTPLNNTVKFNGTSATVANATSTSLTMTVPPGATTGTITVSVGGQTATSATNFTLVSTTTLQTNFPSTFNDGGSLTASVTASDPTQVARYDFVYQAISASSVKRMSNASNSVTLSANQFNDQLGYQYHFEAITTWGDTVKSNLGISVINFPNTSSNKFIPSLVFGDQPKDYQIISIPLKLVDAKVTSIFASLGQYNNTQWRLFNYSGGVTKEYPTFSGITPGQGYWLIARKLTSIDPGSGTAVDATPATPFTINLTTGWNLIGNPYNFSISWSDVLAYNNNPVGVGNLKTFVNGTLGVSDVLPRFRGAFVFSTNAVSVKIPVLKNLTINSGRIGTQPEVERITNEDWQVPLQLSDGVLTNALGGIGMTILGKHINNLSEEHIPIPEGLGLMQIAFTTTTDKKQYVKSIVPAISNYTWNASIIRYSDKPLTLTWPTISIENGMGLFLIDKMNGIAKDMTTENSYTISSNVSSIQIVYGDSRYIKNALDNALPLLHACYPNPTSGTLYLPVHVADNLSNTKVSAVIYNQLGKETWRWETSYLNPGDYEFNLSPNLPSGIYILKLLANNGESRTQKIIIN